MRRSLPWLALVWSGLVGCSAVVSGDPPPTVACRVEGGVDPCEEVAAGARCVTPPGGDVGVCTTGECGREVCANSLDDDCDGAVDEGDPETCNDVDDDCDGTVDEDLDDDEDGFTWCATGPGPRDCDDARATVRPTASGGIPVSEACDGLDNDCDPLTADGQGECSATEDCDPVAGCIEINCRTRPELCGTDQFCDQGAEPPVCRPLVTSCLDPLFPCTAPERCDPTNGQCVTAQPSGTDCNSDAQCASNLCVPVDAIGFNTEDVGGMRGLCSRACCDDADCDGDDRCWASGSGARACVPPSRLSAGPLGAPTVETCAGPLACDEECGLLIDDAFRQMDRVSLTCRAPFAFPETCSNDFACGFSGICLGGTCREFCDAASDCPTGMCVGNSCRDSCRSRMDCPTNAAFYPNASCVFVGFYTTGDRTDWVPACSYTSGGAGTGKEACTSDDGCRDRTCVAIDGATTGADRRCADTCCSDTQCASGEQCRPIFVHGRWEPHCLTRPSF